MPQAKRRMKKPKTETMFGVTDVLRRAFAILFEMGRKNTFSSMGSYLLSPYFSLVFKIIIKHSYCKSFRVYLVVHEWRCGNNV